MARRNETTTEKIVRLYKEGMSIEKIAKELGMPKNNVPQILEKHMPDYATYHQAGAEKKPEEPEQTTTSGSSEVGKKGLSSLFGKKKTVTKDAPAEEEEKPKITINLTMNENGFVDGTVRGIAQMLQNGKDVSTIADFFNRDEEDIIAVRACMDEHFKRASESTSATPSNSSTTETRSHSRANVYATSGLENFDTDKPVEQVSGYTPPKFEVPDIPADEEMPSIDPVSLDVLDKQIEKLDRKEEPAEEMPSVEPAVQSEPEKPETINTETKEDDSMSPMEKMKQFAQTQIDENNKKIEELKSKKIDIDNAEYELNRKVSEINTKIAEEEKKIAELRAQSEEIKAQKEKTESAVKEILSSIADIEKENEEFKSYFK